MIPATATLIAAILVFTLASAGADTATCGKIVYCNGGMAYSGAGFITSTGTSCVVECRDNCCKGNEACNVGHFAVCVDAGDGSCNGTQGMSIVVYV